MSNTVTANMLYNLIQCPHRVTLDLYGNPSRMDDVSPFVRLLWEKGNAFEEELIEGLQVPFTSLRSYRGDEKERLTLAAMKRGDALIYSGRISSGGLLGEPDLLRREGDGYEAGDIKSGAGEEGADDNAGGKPKRHYAVQLALYTDILERIGMSAVRKPFVWDARREEVVYNLDERLGVRTAATLWDVYVSALGEAHAILRRESETLPAYASQCKLCQWRTACRKQLEQIDDLTLIPELGRTKRDTMSPHIGTVNDLARANLKDFLQGGKTIFPGVGKDKLYQYRERALLQKTRNAKPYLKEPLTILPAERELFFDVETDPMRDLCYLHGFMVRAGTGEHYESFFAAAPTPEEEERAFRDAVQFIRASMPCRMYHYSHYERTILKKLQRRYPNVISASALDAIFDPSMTLDLYTDVVRSKSEWPTRDHSIKTLAMFLGFSWRDREPSGAASIEWYHRLVETGDGDLKQRILDYNEDDCIAMRVLLDAILKMPVRGR